MGELRGLHVVVPAELVVGTYTRAEREGKTLSEAVTGLLEGYADRMIPPAARVPRKRQAPRPRKAAEKG